MYHKQNRKQCYVIGLGFYAQGWKARYHQMHRDVYFMGKDTVAGKITGGERCRECSKQNVPAIFYKNI